MIDQMLIPGKIENWFIISDLCNRSIFKLPIKELKNIISSLKSQRDNKEALKDIMDKKSQLKSNSQQNIQNDLSNYDLTDPLEESLIRNKLNKSQSNSNRW